MIGEIIPDEIQNQEDIISKEAEQQLIDAEFADIVENMETTVPAEVKEAANNEVVCKRAGPGEWTRKYWT